jgi:peptidoglycan/LPS O-acetylase OafA/YrhL
MELEEGMVRKIAISVGAVGVFVALVVGIGSSFNDGGLGSAGGLALVASIAAFILVMAGVGFLLAD